MNIGLIIIGDEILSGQARRQASAQGDRAARGARPVARVGALRRRRSGAHHRRPDATRSRSGDLVFSCGGIGATPDDHTRQCAAAALGVPLALHPGGARLRSSSACSDDRARAGHGRSIPSATTTSIASTWACFPQGAAIIPNRTTRSRASVRSGDGGVFFVPGFPVMAWPMIEWVLDTHYRAPARRDRDAERSVIVFGAMEAALTPLMEAIESTSPASRCSACRASTIREWGRHIELGVKGEPRCSTPPTASCSKGCRRERQARPGVGALTPAAARVIGAHGCTDSAPPPGRPLARFLLNSVRDFGAPVAGPAPFAPPHHTEFQRLGD